jgi:predicted nucleic acid-binding protein
VKHLLDVNALLACEHQGSPHHEVFHAWAKRTGLRNLVTCGLVELGFIRVSMQVFGYSLAQAQTALAAIKPKLGGFIETAPSPQLSSWASTPGKTTDAYLAQIAARHGLTLATFDHAIPGTLLIR